MANDESAAKVRIESDPKLKQAFIRFLNEAGNSCGTLASLMREQPSDTDHTIQDICFAKFNSAYDRLVGRLHDDDVAIVREIKAGFDAKQFESLLTLISEIRAQNKLTPDDMIALKELENESFDGRGRWQGGRPSEVQKHGSYESGGKRILTTHYSERYSSLRGRDKIRRNQ